MSAQSAQLSLFSEEELYHDTNLPGFFSILYATDSKKKQQRSYRLEMMPDVIRLLDKTRDTWISQADFMRPNRRLVNLWRLPMLFVDLDTYTVNLKGDPDFLAKGLLTYCYDQSIPPPSLIVFSGRGLQAKWLLSSSLPRAALPRWNAAQAVLIDRLSAFGADKQAKDASRVLRLVGAVHSKSGQIARVVHVTEENGEPIRYSFEFLCEWLFKMTRDEYREMIREEREKYRKSRERRPFRVFDGEKSTNLRGFSSRQLSWDRLEDLRTLVQLRGGTVPEGSRMLHLHWQLNFLLLSGATNWTQMYHEAKALAHAINPNWHHEQSALSTLYAKAKQMAAGEKVEFEGKKYPSLYTPKNQTLIDKFEITDDEQRQLKTIITPALARERHADRERARRAAAGATPHSKSDAQLKPWEKLGMSRRTWYRKGKPEPCGQVELSTCG